MEDVWDFDFLPPGLGWTDLATEGRKGGREGGREHQQVSTMLSLPPSLPSFLAWPAPRAHTFLHASEHTLLFSSPSSSLSLVRSFPTSTHTGSPRALVPDGPPRALSRLAPAIRSLLLLLLLLFFFVLFFLLFFILFFIIIVEPAPERHGPSLF
jgi:hypothetical protein